MIIEIVEEMTACVEGGCLVKMLYVRRIVLAGVPTRTEPNNAFYRRDPASSIPLDFCTVVQDISAYHRHPAKVNTDQSAQHQSGLRVQPAWHFRWTRVKIRVEYSRTILSQ